VNKSPIEWTQYTSNPIRAFSLADQAKKGHHCVKISPGCANCYASRLQTRFGMPTFDKAQRSDVEMYLDEKELQRLLKRRKYATVFLGDMTDIFGEWAPEAWLDRIFAVMALTPNTTYQLLTKRSKRMREYLDLTNTYRDDVIAMWAKELHTSISPFRLPSEGVFDAARVAKNERWKIVQWPLPNVWPGVSVESQQYADERIPDLLQTPATVRFLSVEPLLGPVVLDADWLYPRCAYCGRHSKRGATVCDYHKPPRDACVLPTVWEKPGLVDWVIVGGESGPGARFMKAEWVESIREQCVQAKVPFFFKQWGGVRKKETGRLLHGREWNEMP
jgi:protein gp37